MKRVHAEKGRCDERDEGVIDEALRDEKDQQRTEHVKDETSEVVPERLEPEEAIVRHVTQHRDRQVRADKWLSENLFNIFPRERLDDGIADDVQMIVEVHEAVLQRWNEHQDRQRQRDHEKDSSVRWSRPNCR